MAIDGARRISLRRRHLTTLGFCKDEHPSNDEIRQKYIEKVKFLGHTTVSSSEGSKQDHEIKEAYHFLMFAPEEQLAQELKDENDAFFKSFVHSLTNIFGCHEDDLECYDKDSSILIRENPNWNINKTSLVENGFKLSKEEQEGFISVRKKNPSPIQTSAKPSSSLPAFTSFHLYAYSRKRKSMPPISSSPFPSSSQSFQEREDEYFSESFEKMLRIAENGLMDELQSLLDAQDTTRYKDDHVKTLLSAAVNSGHFHIALYLLQDSLIYDCAIKIKDKILSVFKPLIRTPHQMHDYEIISGVINQSDRFPTLRSARDIPIESLAAHQRPSQSIFSPRQNR